MKSEDIGRRLHEGPVELTGTNADQIALALKQAGVQRVFGMPGGGNAADLVEAAGRVGLPFSLAHTEVGATFMATAQAEILQKPGACLATLGPGVASIVNGIANAYLDRVPLIVITDCYSNQAQPGYAHHNLPHEQLLSGITKWSERLDTNVGAAVSRAVQIAMSAPCGPVYLDLTGDVAAKEPTRAEVPASSCVAGVGAMSGISDQTRNVLARSRRPVLLLGIGARGYQVPSKELRG